MRCTAPAAAKVHQFVVYGSWTSPPPCVRLNTSMLLGMLSRHWPAITLFLALLLVGKRKSFFEVSFFFLFRFIVAFVCELHG